MRGRLNPFRLALLMMALAGSADAQVTAPRTLATTPTPAAASAQAATPGPSPTALTPAQARQALEVLRDEKKRNEVITTLEAISRAPVAATQPTASTEAPAAAEAPAKPAAADLPLAPDSLGAQLVLQVSQLVSRAGDQFVRSVAAVNDLPLLWRWLKLQMTDDAARARLLDAAWKLLVVLAAALAAEWVVRTVLGRLRAVLSRGAHTMPAPRPPDPSEDESGLAAAEAGESEHSARQRRLTGALSALRRLPFLVGRLLLDLVPILAFAIVGNLLMSTALGEPQITRLAIIAVVQSYAACRAVLAVIHLLVAPDSPHQRLLGVSDWAAEFLFRWARRIAIVAIAGYAATEVGLLFGMYRTAYEAILKLFALVVHIFLVVAVLEARVPIARRIHARTGRTGIWATLLNRFSEIWHLVAIFYIAALWLVWAAELRNGYLRLLNFVLVSIAIIIVARLISIVILGGLDRLRVGSHIHDRHPNLDARLNAYYPLIRAVLTAAIGAATLIALFEAWGFQIVSWLQLTGLGSRAASAIMVIGVTVLVAVLVWEGVNAGIELHLSKLSQSAQLTRAGRLRTLLPMLRTALLVVIVLVVGLMSLSELGVNIAPLLAGAGVVGIAVGFGSQKLVQDLITGLFLLLENAMQVGDVVTLGGLSGTVEALSIRTIRLRAVDGSVHIIPFSAVTTVTNQTRDYGYAVLDISVGLNEDVGRVIGIVKAVAEEMRDEPKWQAILLDPMDVLGVDKFVDTAYVLRARMKTQPSSRWAVGRELNRRIKERFDALAIESPFTSYRVLSTNPAPPAASSAQEAA